MQRSNTTAILLLFIFLIGNTDQFCYIFNRGNGVNGPKVVTHTSHYNGTGGTTTSVKVGINPASSNLAAFRIPILNNILIWNLQIATQKNTKALADPNTYDIESVSLHEMGHAIGLGHTNLASESNLGHPLSEATAAYIGTDGVYTVDPGVDGVYGSYDDNRGDDLNLNYFNPSNNPFILATPTDKTIYKNNITYLPDGHKFATTAGMAESVYLIAKRAVNEEEDLDTINDLSPIVHFHPSGDDNEDQDNGGHGLDMKNQKLCTETLLTHPNRQTRIRSGSTEAIMQQGTYQGEAQRTLCADDVAGLYYARAGVDAIVGTADDYYFNLIYVGESTGNDIDVYLDPTYTGVGTTSANSNTLGGYHYSITTATIRINPTISWFYNPLLTSVIFFPKTQSQSIDSNAVMTLDLYFASAGPPSVSTSDLTYTSTIGGSVNLIKVDGAHYTIQISGFTESGIPCIKLSSTSLMDSKYSAPYEPSNQICFSVTLAGSTPSPAASSISPSPSAASASPVASPSVAPSSSSVSSPSSNNISPSSIASISPAPSPISASPVASPSTAPSSSSISSPSSSISRSNAATSSPSISKTSSPISKSPSPSRIVPSLSPSKSKSPSVSIPPSKSPSKSKRKP